MTSVRDAVAPDAEVIAGLIGELGYPTTADAITERSATLTAHGLGRVIVAEERGRIVGVATLSTIHTLHRPGGGVCRITALVVSGDARGLGVGRSLVYEIERHAAATGCARVEVTSAQQRTDAHQFYWRLGYRETPKRFVKDLPTPSAATAMHSDS